MKTIRRGVFETNSSSTHSITICSKDEYDGWERGEFLISDSDNLLTKEEAIEELKNNKWFNKNHKDFDWNDTMAVNEILEENDYYTQNEYFNHGDLESFVDTYTTKNGEEVVAFGKFGYDG